MSKKLSALAAQKMKLSQCMAVCATDAVQDTYRKGRWLLLILAVVLGIGYFWDDIIWAIGTAFSAIWSFLGVFNVSGILGGVGSVWYSLFIEPIPAVYNWVDSVTQWATPFMHAGRTCTTVGEGEAATLSCVIDAEPLNFIAFSISGTLAIFLTAIWFMPVTMFIQVFFSKHESIFSATSWKDVWDEQKDVYKALVPMLMIIWLGSAILAGVMGHFTLELFMSANGSISAGVLMLVPLFLTIIPLIILGYRLEQSEEQTKQALEDEIRIARNRSDIDYDKYSELSDRITNMSEEKPIQMWVSRIVLFSLAGCVFLALSYYGTLLVPDGWGFVGFVAGALAAIAILYPVLAGLITCYANLRNQVSSIEKEIASTKEPEETV